MFSKMTGTEKNNVSSSVFTSFPSHTRPSPAPPGLLHPLHLRDLLIIIVTCMYVYTDAHL